MKQWLWMWLVFDKCPGNSNPSVNDIFIGESRDPDTWMINMENVDRFSIVCEKRYVLEGHGYSDSSMEMDDGKRPYFCYMRSRPISVTKKLCGLTVYKDTTSGDVEDMMKGAYYLVFATFHEYAMEVALNVERCPVTPKDFKSPEYVSDATHLAAFQIDFSYNELFGNFPSWVNQRNMQLNLVANNFVLQGSNSSAMPSGLNCLQRNFSCNRGDPQYSSFAIKRGGSQMSCYAGIVHEADNETLGPATYYVTREHRWAVSNVGLPSGSKNLRYTTNFVTFFPNIKDPELFQSARISAGSLRYYGLDLENGNYNVTLQFGEPEIQNPTSWESLGRRIFNIYIQDNLELKDFNIRKDAGGASFGAVVKEFKAQATNNYLEIHLFWAGKGTCYVPSQGVYGPSISAISVIPDFIPTVSNNPPNDLASGKYRTGLIVVLVVAVGVVISFSLFTIYYLAQRRKGPKRFEDEEFLGMDARPYTFNYVELRTATDDFSSSNKIGEGGFGPVYKGTLEDGRIVAVKQLSVASHQEKSQFVAEIVTISGVRHRNLVKFGYLAPEYALRGVLTEKADVFGFGVVALEIISGRVNSDSSLEEDQRYLLEWAWHLHENNRGMELVDKNLSSFNEDESSSASSSHAMPRVLAIDSIWAMVQFFP
ncbi:unnamed protein product [Fraxinus pennsylvanica]|uniref:non-specific serine/threonine protein kinase n=1 Tax=Fraxinus pennsylvanica TaxID=56036 RepID=A0AAD1YUI4_9LAMI|nr:unnamed protein product [Fraxinus pennsylvanica]